MVAYACNPTPERLRQEDICKYELSLGYRTRACQRGCGGRALLWFIVYIHKPSHIYKPETCPLLGEGIQ